MSWALGIETLACARKLCLRLHLNVSSRDQDQPCAPRSTNQDQKFPFNTFRRNNKWQTKI